MKTEPGKKKKKSIVKEIFGTAFFLAVLFASAWLLIHYVGERTTVVGESMAPLLGNGDQIIIDKISYRFSGPKRFDIIVFPFQYQEGTYYIKRVIALPGETVRILDQEIYINGSKLEDPYGSAPIVNAGLASDTITLGQDEYFVLGDNRNDSSDSREPSVGNINRDQIIGRAFFRFWPLSRVGLLR